MYSLIKLTETEKRIIIAIFLVLVILLLLIWLIGTLIIKGLESSGKRIDDIVHDAVTSKVINNPKHFKNYAHKKNWQLFFKKSKYAILIIFFGSIALVVQEILSNFSYNPFSSTEGFGTLLFYWDFNNVEYSEVFFLPFKVMARWPALIHTPTPVVEAWSSYIFVPCLVIGSIWYLIEVSKLFARHIRIRKLSVSIFSKSLENYNQYTSSSTQQTSVVPQYTEPNKNPPSVPNGGSTN